MKYRVFLPNDETQVEADSFLDALVNAIMFFECVPEQFARNSIDTGMLNELDSTYAVYGEYVIKAI